MLNIADFKAIHEVRLKADPEHGFYVAGIGIDKNNKRYAIQWDITNKKADYSKCSIHELYNYFNPTRIILLDAPRLSTRSEHSWITKATSMCVNGIISLLGPKVLIGSK